LHVLGTPPAFTLSQDQTLQFVSEVLKFRLLSLTTSASEPSVPRRACTRCGTFRSCFRSAPGNPAREDQDPFGFTLPPDFSLGSASKDQRKLFNPRPLYDGRALMSLFSFQGTGHAVWQRGLRILPERRTSVKGKVDQRLTFSCRWRHAFPRGHLSGKSTPANAGICEDSSTAPRPSSQKVFAGPEKIEPGRKPRGAAR
jgi:hypothetical protein